MDVFVSWSGSRSKAVAKEIAAYLEIMVPSINTFISSEEIEKGSRWSNEIAGQLQKSDFGIICLTKENSLAPWIQFEAGALAKSLDHGRVCPILFDLDVSDMVGNPLAQFQATPYSREEFEKLVIQIAKIKSADMSEKSKAYFSKFWEEMNEKIEKHLGVSAEKNVQTEDQIEKVLSAVFRQQNMIMNKLSKPEALLPVPYLAKAIRRSTDSNSQLRNMDSYIDEVDGVIGDIQRLVMFIDFDDPEELEGIVRDTERLVTDHILFEDRGD